MTLESTWTCHTYKHNNMLTLEQINTTERDSTYSLYTKHAQKYLSTSFKHTEVYRSVHLNT